MGHLVNLKKEFISKLNTLMETLYEEAVKNKGFLSADMNTALMKAHKAIIREYTKLIPKCRDCFDKGWGTGTWGYYGGGDFIGDPEYIDPVRERLTFCKCERGLNLKKLIEANYAPK